MDKMSTTTIFAPISSSHHQKITQTYSLAHMARRKLAREASRSDLNLSRLVGHANLLDSLMLELRRVERDQHQKQKPVNVTVQRTVKPDSSRHIQWADCVVVESDEDWNLSDTESDEGQEDCDSEACTDMEANMVSLQRVPSRRNLSSMNTQNAITCSSLMSYLDVDEDDDEDFDVLQLEYSSSHSSPPELDHDSDSSEDEAMPPSPPASPSPSFLSTNPSAQNHSKSIVSENISTEPLIFNKAYYAPLHTNSDLNPTISVF